MSRDSEHVVPNLGNDIFTVTSKPVLRQPHVVSENAAWRDDQIMGSPTTATVSFVLTTVRCL